MDEEYKVISEFSCHGNKMITVRIENAVHVMGKTEWLSICGFDNQNRYGKINRKYAYNGIKNSKVS